MYRNFLRTSNPSKNLPHIFLDYMLYANSKCHNRCTILLRVKIYDWATSKRAKSTPSTCTVKNEQQNKF
jgi:hypothetical protein